MSAQGQTGIRRIVSAAVNSISGLEAAWTKEAAFRQECIGALVLLPTAFWVGDTAVERLLLIGSCMIVLITELLNSAVEVTIDRIGTEHHPLSGRAKDLGSAAVFVSLALTGLIWATIAWQNFR